MKITLSTPSTTSSAVSVTSAIRLSEVSSASMVAVRDQAVAARRGLCAQAAALTQSSASRRRSTGSPPARWRSTISATSARVTPPYHTASG